MKFRHLSNIAIQWEDAPAKKFKSIQELVQELVLEVQMASSRTSELVQELAFCTSRTSSSS